MMWTVMWIAGLVYTAFLGLLVIVIAVRGTLPMLRTILAIFGWFLAANAWTISHGGGEPWALFFALDVIAALVILIMPAGKMQSLIGTTFLIKLAFDTAYGLAVFYGYPEPVKYWWALTILGFIQLLLVGGWWLSERFPSHVGLRRIRRFDRLSRPPGMA